jgi:hypothetical protein
MVLGDMLALRWKERAMLRLIARDLDTPWDQARWDRSNQETTMLYVLLGEVSRENPRFTEIAKAVQRAFWRECQALFAEATVSPREPGEEPDEPKGPKTYEPRTDPNLAYR